MASRTRNSTWLDPTDADALDLDPAAIGYTTLTELGAPEKAIRDAGSIPVAEF